MRDEERNSLKKKKLKKSEYDDIAQKTGSL